MPSEHPGPRTRQRALQPDDHAAVQALFQRHGWPQRSRAGWDWALTQNPARKALGGDAGWVLEHGDQVVGFLANLPMLYQLDGRSLSGATCSSFLVDESHRAHSMGLLRAFAAQPGAAFVFSATANPNSAPLYKAFRFQPSPLPQSNQRLRWWACESTVADHLLDRSGIGFLKPLGRAAAALPASWRKLQRAAHSPALPHGLQVTRLDPTELRADVAGPWQQRWDDWAMTYSSRAGLWVDRSAATTAWRLSDPDFVNPGVPDRIALWVLHHHDGRIWGQCSARLLPPTPCSPAKVEMLDWAVQEAFAPFGSAALLNSVLDWAHGRGAAMVDASRYSGEPAAQLAALKPQHAPLPADGVWVLAHQRWACGSSTPWQRWGMTGADSDDWFNTGVYQTSNAARAWVPPLPLANRAAQVVCDVSDVRAADSSATRSDADSTVAGSKRSMSTV